MQTDGIQPMVTLDDCLEAEDICKGDKGFQQLLRDRYDITDLASVACDPWYYGGRYRDSKHLASLHFPSFCPAAEQCVHVATPGHDQTHVKQQKMFLHNKLEAI